MLTLPFILAAVMVQQPQPLQPKSKMSPAAREAIQKLQGSWQIEIEEEDGEKTSPGEVKNRTLLFAGDALFITRKHIVLETIGMKIDPAKVPTTLNAIILDGPNKGDILQGIYALDGDSLKICLDPKGDQRPKEFKAPKGSGLRLYVCKRIRAKGEESDLSGEYVSETLDAGGKKLTATVKIERSGDAYLVTYQKNESVLWVGLGMRKGNVFAMSWLAEGQMGITLYDIEPDGKLVGTFTQFPQAPGVVGRETLSRAKKDV